MVPTHFLLLRFQYDVSGDNVFFLNVENAKGCVDTPTLDCTELCHVEITADTRNPPVRIDIRCVAHCCALAAFGQLSSFAWDRHS
jgi:hypothetical protein